MRTFIILFILIMLFPSCKCKKIKGDNWTIELPETKNPVNMNQWAVTKYSYIRLREKAVPESKIINYIPHGKILSVIKKENKIRSFNNKKDYWYFVDYDGEKGWLFGSFIEIYNNYDMAEKRCEEILLKELNEEKKE